MSSLEKLRSNVKLREERKGEVLLAYEAANHIILCANAGTSRYTIYQTVQLLAKVNLGIVREVLLTGGLECRAV